MNYIKGFMYIVYFTSKINNTDIKFIFAGLKILIEELQLLRHQLESMSNPENIMQTHKKLEALRYYKKFINISKSTNRNSIKETLFYKYLFDILSFLVLNLNEK